LRPEPSVYLWDARAAAAAILDFTSGKTLATYTADAVLSAAVERKFTVLGEALAQLAKAAPDMARQIPDLPRIVAFRNLLIHGYAVVEPARVWAIVEKELPGLKSALEGLLGDAQLRGS
jgi:uncharacterized protein with HEPN domain